MLKRKIICVCAYWNVGDGLLKIGLNLVLVNNVEDNIMVVLVKNKEEDKLRFCV